MKSTKMICSRRRQYQWSVRSLLLLILLVGTFCGGWLAHEQWLRWQADRTSVDAVDVEFLGPMGGRIEVLDESTVYAVRVKKPIAADGYFAIVLDGQGRDVHETKFFETPEQARNQARQWIKSKGGNPRIVE